MLKNLVKILLFSFLSFQMLNAASVVNDGFEELKKGNILEAANIFQNACNEGASSGCYNLGLLYYKGDKIAKNYSKAFELIQSKATIPNEEEIEVNSRARSAKLRTGIKK